MAGVGAAFGIVVSLVVMLFMTRKRMAWSFFSLPARAWELGLGAAAAAAAAERCVRPSFRWLAPAGAATLTASMVLVSDTRPFPGVQAFLPAIGTVLVLLGGAGTKGPVQAFLSLGPLRGLGRVSYARYLWHWPVFLWLGLRRDDAPVSTVVVGMMISVAIAMLVMFYFEEPLRNSPLRRGLARPAVSLVIAVTAGAAAPGGLSFFGPVRHDPRRQALERASRDKVHVRGCDAWIDDVPASCVFGAKAAVAGHTILVVGDSHAMHWLPALDAFGASHGVRVVYRGLSPCPGVPLHIVRKKVPFRACEATHASLPSALGLLRPALVVSSSTVGHWVTIDDASADADREHAWADAIARLDAAVRATGSRLVLLHDVPHWLDPIRSLADGGSCGAAEADWDRVPAMARMVEVSIGQALEVAVVDPRPAICAEHPCLPIDERGVVKFWDAAHLTDRYSASLEPFLSNAMLPIVASPQVGP